MIDKIYLILAALLGLLVATVSLIGTLLLWVIFAAIVWGVWHLLDQMPL